MFLSVLKTDLLVKVCRVVKGRHKRIHVEVDRNHKAVAPLCAESK